MSQHAFRKCPNCGPRDLSESSCAICGWDLQFEDIHDTEQTADTKSSPEKNANASRKCPQGHQVDPGDLICNICNSEIDESLGSQTSKAESNSGQSNDSENPDSGKSINGWQVIGAEIAVGKYAHRMAVKSSSDGKSGLLTLYCQGAEPDTAVQKALTRIPREHVPELYEAGNYNGQAYEVFEDTQEGTVAGLELCADDLNAVRHFVQEISRPLDYFAEMGLRHRDIRPELLLVRSNSPLDIVVSGFGSARLSDLDLEVVAPLEVNRYMAPEAVMGGVSPASDWWGLGMILLDKITKGRCFESVNEQLFMIHVVANGAPIPDNLPSELDVLLRGLLAFDRLKRWRGKEVRAWLNGENVAAPVVTHKDSHHVGPTIRLFGREIASPQEFALSASRVVQWDEACELFEHGLISKWAEEIHLEAKNIAAIRQLQPMVDIPVDFRFAIVLKLLLPSLPLICREKIISPAWLLENHEQGYALISGAVPDLLLRYGMDSEAWLQRIAKSAANARNYATAHGIQLREDLFRTYVLCTSRATLESQWNEKRRLFPDANIAALSVILDRKHYTEEDYAVLLSANISQFIPNEQIIDQVFQEASSRGLAIPSDEFLRLQLLKPRRALYEELDQRIENFACCNNDVLDSWGDEFRHRRRLPFVQLLLLLNTPVESWFVPRNQEYIAQLLGFFEKKIAGAIQRGPLARMTITKTAPRIDLQEIATDSTAANDLLARLLRRNEHKQRIDPSIFQTLPNPESKLRRLEAITSTYQRDTGVNGLFLGFPFLLRQPHGTNTKTKIAPVLLWPIKLQGEVGNRGRFTLSFDCDRQDVRLNPAFDGLLGLESAQKWKDVAEELKERQNLSIAEVIDAFGDMAEVLERELVS